MCGSLELHGVRRWNRKWSIEVHHQLDNIVVGLKVCTEEEVKEKERKEREGESNRQSSSTWKEGGRVSVCD